MRKKLADWLNESAHSLSEIKCTFRKEKIPQYSKHFTTFSFLTLTCHGEERKSSRMYMFLNGRSGFFFYSICFFLSNNTKKQDYRDKRAGSGLPQIFIIT